MPASAPHVLVATKLHIPATRPGYVRRRPLVDALLATEATIVLLSAPPGAGKTTLLAEWCAATREREPAWLSLDQEDGDPVLFWTGVIAALQTVAPDVGGAAQAALASPGTSLTGAALPLLVNELAALEKPIALVLDDYHVIADAEVHRSMTWLIEHRPPNLQVVLATRSDPPFPLARLRARGEVIELRAADLRFSDVEAAGLLNGRLGLGLDAADIGRLQTRTEGWAAGLQLAGLSLRGRSRPHEFIAAFAGDDRHVVDYLGAEVLDTLPPEMRRFMRRTAILDRLAAPLCDAVTGEEGSAARLDDIEHSNLFLVPLDEKRRWYRYHHLFADLLRQDLETAEPELVPELHRRAAAWLRDDGEIPEAVQHALAGSDDATAAELAAEHWSELFNRGQLTTVSRWLDALPPERVRSDPRLWLARVWTAMDRGRMPEVEPLLSGEEAAAAGPWVGVLRALQRLKVGDVGTARDAAARAVATDADAPAFRRTVALLVLGVAEHWRGELDAARPALSRARELASEDGNDLAVVYATGYCGLGALDSGDLAMADRELARGAALTEEEPRLDEHFVAFAVHLAAGRRALLRADAAGAAAELERAVELARRGASPVELAACLLALGEVGRTGPVRSRALGEARDLLAACADAGRLGAAAASPAATPAANGGDLSERELAVLRLLPTGLSQREIGEQLYVSVNTVKSHTRRIFAKLEVGGREAAVQRARERGLL
jgi:LuxR family transcriptional regulator, maltose regulon positive regulatory protein